MMKEKKNKLDFGVKSTESYNKSFTIKELRKALKKCNDTATGPDNIHY